MLALDAFLLTRVFTPIAWWIERHTGRNNFRQAEWCCWSTATGYPLWLFVLYLIRPHLWWFIPLMVVPAIGWVWMCWEQVQTIRVKERLLLVRPELVAILTNRVRLPTLIGFFVLGSAMLSLDIAELHGWLLIGIPTFYYAVPLAFSNYLVTVPFPPPQRKKERDWFWFLRPMPVPT